MTAVVTNIRTREVQQLENVKRVYSWLCGKDWVWAIDTPGRDDYFTVGKYEIVITE